MAVAIRVPSVGLVAQSRLTSQPRSATGIDWGHPLARGLLFSAYNSQQDFNRPIRDYVTGRVGTFVKGTLVTDTRGVAAEADGTSTYADIPLELRGNKQITLTCWALITAYGSGYQFLRFGDGNSYANKNSFWLYPNSGTGLFSAAVTGSESLGSTGVTIQEFTRPSIGVWHHFAVRMNLLAAAAQNTVDSVMIDGVTTQLFQNGFYGTSGTGFDWSTGLHFNVWSFDQGATSWGVGRVQNINIHNRLLYEVDVRRLMNNPYVLLRPPRRYYLGPGNVAYVPFMRPRTQLTAQPQGAVTLDKSHPLSRGLVFSTFNTARDSVVEPIDVVSGRLGTKVGASSFTTGTRGVGKRFLAANSDYSQFPLDLSAFTKISIAFWLNWDAFSNDGKILAEFPIGGWGNSGFLLDPNEGGSTMWNFGIAGPTSAPPFYLGQMFQPSGATWHHYGVVFDRTNAAGYVPLTTLNGLAQTLGAAQNGTVSGNFASGTLTLGCAAALSGFGSGVLANFCIWGRGLSLVEFKKHMANPWQLFLPSTQATKIGAAYGLQTFSGNFSHFRHTAQPTRRVALDAGHPNAKGLVFSALNFADEVRQPYDVVKQKYGTVTGCTVQTGSRGVVTGFVAHPDQLFIPCDLSPYNKLTISWWMIYESIYSNSDHVCLEYGNALGGQLGIYVDPDASSGTGTWLTEIYSSASQRCGRYVNGRPSANVWHHYAIQIDMTQSGNQMAAIFFDAVSQTLATYAQNLNANQVLYGGGGFILNGVFSSASYKMAGKIQNLNVHSSLLSAAQIRSVMNNPWAMFINPRAPQVLISITTSLIPNTLSGIVTINAVPVVGAVVRLYDEYNGALLRTTVTDASGAYQFGGIGDELNTSMVYTIIAYDALTGYQYNAGRLRGMIAGNT